MKLNKEPCVVEGCDRPQHSKGYCNRHYLRLWRTGTTEKLKQSRQSLAETAYRLRRLKQDLDRAQECYETVVGLANRIRWRKEVDDIKREIERIAMEAAAQQWEEHAKPGKGLLAAPRTTSASSAST